MSRQDKLIVSKALDGDVDQYEFTKVLIRAIDPAYVLAPPKKTARIEEPPREKDRRAYLVLSAATVHRLKTETPKKEDEMETG